MITLRTLLSMPELGELAIIAGEAGLDHIIRAVATLDAPDGPRWLRGNEFILTSSYIFKDNPDGVEQFVRELIEVGAAGLGFKAGRYLGEVPAGVLAIANAHAFPILTIPEKMVWSDVIAPFYELRYKISSSANTIKLEPNMIDEIFMASKWGAGAMMERMTEFFEIPMAVLYRNKRVVRENGLPGVEKLRAVLSGRKLFVENSEDTILKTDEGYLLIRSVPFTQEGKREYIAMLTENRNFLEEVSNLFKLLERFRREDRTAGDDRESRYRRLLMDVVSDKATPESLSRFAAPREPGERVYERIALLRAPQWKEISAELKTQLCAGPRRAGVQLESHLFYDENCAEAVLLIEGGGEAEEKLGVRVRAAVAAVEPMLTASGGLLAVGRQCGGMEGLPESYRQARKAARLGPVLWKDRPVYYYSSVAVYSMVSALGAPDLDMGDIHLLEESQKQFSFDGITTLEAYLEASSYKRAAAKLYIHENTMRYRVQKICELLKIDIEDPQFRQSMMIKIKLWRLLKLEEKPGRARPEQKTPL